MKTAALCFLISVSAFAGEKISLKNSKIESVVLPVQDIKTVKHGQYSYQMKTDRRFLLNLSSGELQEIHDDKAAAPQDKSADNSPICIPPKTFSEMKKILSSDEVCTEMPADNKAQKQKVQEPQLCASMMKKSYLDLQIGSRVIALGSATDSCGNNATDICSPSSREKLQYLVNFLKHEFKKHQFKKYKCPKK